MPSTKSKSKKLNRSEGVEGGRLVPRLREPRYSQSLERGLAILTCFTPQRPMMGIADIADELGMSRSTTHRYMITLVELGYLEQGGSRKYRLGLRVTDLGMSVLNSMSLREYARPDLEELRQETRFTVNLAILDGSEILYVDRVRGSRPGQSKIDFALHVGSRLPASCTALGKLLLAYLPDAEQEALIASLKLAKGGPNAIASKKALKAELGQISEEGLAVDDEELAAEVQAIAAPVRSSGGEVIAAVGLVGLRSMITVDELVVSLSPRLIATGARISARLGFRRDDER
ncbi:MAG TPA: IclR family transcriptional regulator [Solirubrobacteraceae bacterium]|jgi:IclR family pca regulon transcriptional regulator|nr:IclR family transcriptional regulator [Solirubrobacteraceae bacterium]